MNATCPTKPAVTETPPALERRAADGTFVNRPGPGRPSKRWKALSDRYKRETLAETARTLADDIPRLESELQAIDDELTDAERKFLEQIAPTARHRAKVAVTLSRARVAAHYVADPLGFQGSSELPADEALREYREVRRQLDDAQRELADTIEPAHDRAEALADADKWAEVHTYETARDRVNSLLAEEKRARKKAEGLGNAIPLLQSQMTMEGDPFKRGPLRRSGVMEQL